jgi:hypothetical protein
MSSLSLHPTLTYDAPKWLSPVKVVKFGAGRRLLHEVEEEAAM